MEIILTQEQWNYTQQGLTGEGAAIVALAVAVATAGTGSGISAAITGSAGSATVGAMAGSAFTALVSQASISLINNQGNVKAALKELGSKENVRGLAFAMATAGVSAKLDKTLAKYPIKTGQNSAFSDKVIKGIGEGVSRGILENVVYGTDLEDALVKNLKGQLTNAATAAAFSDFVKHMDADSGDQNLVIKNISHKLAAALTGCISAAVNSQSCESGAVGAAVGEMFGDFVVDKNTGVIDEKQREKLINQARLLAGISAAFSGNDVNTATDKAGEAVRWNSTIGSDTWLYHVGGGKEHAQRQASLAAYCAEQGGNMQTCMNNAQYIQNQFNLNKNLATKIADVHNYYNDMTIVSLSGGMAGYTAIVNNKSGEVWVSNFPELGVNLGPDRIKELSNTLKLNPSGKISRSVGFGASINFGSIKGGLKDANQINEAIQGSSLGIQACNVACAGIIRTEGKNPQIIYTYGAGTTQIGISGGKMKKTGIILSQENIKELIKIK